MSKVIARILFPVFVVATMLAFGLALWPSIGHAHTASSASERAARSLASAGQPIAPNQPGTPTPEPQATSQPGSTDGLVIMSFAIVVILVVPILLQRGLWAR